MLSSIKRGGVDLNAPRGVPEMNQSLEARERSCGEGTFEGMARFFCSIVTGALAAFENSVRARHGFPGTVAFPGVSRQHMCIMTRPVPTSGWQVDRGPAWTAAIGLRKGWGRWFIGVVVLQGMVLIPVSAASVEGPGRQERDMGAAWHRRAISDEEIEALWKSHPPRSTAHRGYIFIDEEDIVEEYELPVFRVEAQRFGPRGRLERMAGEDRGAALRIAELDPRLARETLMHARREYDFFAKRSPGVARDVGGTQAFVFTPSFERFKARR